MKQSLAKIRAEKMLKSDRIGLSADAEELIRRDISQLLLEYFTLKRPVKVLITGDGENLKINIEAQAKGVKKFNLLK